MREIMRKVLRTLMMFFVLLLCMTVHPVQAAEENEQSKSYLKDGIGYIYTTINGKEGYWACTCMSDMTKLNIPEKVNGKPVIYVGQGFKDSKIEDVVIPKSVIALSPDAFLNCKNLKKVTLPDNNIQIGENAFSGCFSLQTVTCKSAKTIGAKAFFNCTKLTRFAIPKGVKTLEEKTFSGCSSLERVSFPKGMDMDTIGSYAFENCNNLTDVSWPNSVRIIMPYAFSGCSKLKTFEVGFEKAKLDIGDGAFFRCKSLQSVVFPENLKTIGKRAFFQCTALSKAEFPDTMQAKYTIGTQAFYGCKKLRKLTLQGDIKIGSNAFGKISKLCIYGAQGSWVQVYAARNGINFKLLLSAQKIYADSVTKALGAGPFQLSVKTEGKCPLSYKSNNKSVATVSSEGKVTLKGFGKAVITIKAAATSYYKAASKKIAVVVIPKK